MKWEVRSTGRLGSYVGNCGMLLNLEHVSRCVGLMVSFVWVFPLYGCFRSQRTSSGRKRAYVSRSRDNWDNDQEHRLGGRKNHLFRMLISSNMNNRMKTITLEEHFVRRSNQMN